MTKIFSTCIKLSVKATTHTIMRTHTFTTRKKKGVRGLLIVETTVRFFVVGKPETKGNGMVEEREKNNRNIDFFPLPILSFCFSLRRRAEKEKQKKKNQLLSPFSSG